LRLYILRHNFKEVVIFLYGWLVVNEVHEAESFLRRQ
jgi:hypothetical protein